ncbi:hypothetical protein tb265_30920 [Gemmatimonadetes bacterium T265]|nr:hypothetical protein tb265_30920 [Gemmatimonadetes bacterium T265]
MTSRHTSRTAARSALKFAAAAAALAAAACSRDPVVVGTTPPATAPFMARYVAVGNSITAGYQSGGINDSTQRRSYARMLAIAAGVGNTFSYPSFTTPGCPPPIANFLTGVRTSGDTSSTFCALRATSSVTASLNNVAVPGANSWDAVGRGVVPTTTSPASLTVGGYSALTTLILGGQTQLQRAVQLDPTFATVWIGNNDVLLGALQYAGDSSKATNLANFTNNYATLVNGLVTGSPHLKGGVLIGVVDVTNVPLLVPFAIFNPNTPVFSPAAYQAVLGVLGVGTTRPLTFRLLFDGNCTNSAASIAFPALVQLGKLIPAAAPSFTIDCSGATPISATATQTSFLVTDAERIYYATRVAAYNAYIKAKADSIGWAYIDPNTLLATLRSEGAIPPFPNLAAPTAPFATAAGRYITNDGVHPSTSAHFLLANALIMAINTKYGSTIRALTPADTTGL